MIHQDDNSDDMIHHAPVELGGGPGLQLLLQPESEVVNSSLLKVQLNARETWLPYRRTIPFKTIDFSQLQIHALTNADQCKRGQSAVSGVRGGRRQTHWCVFAFLCHLSLLIFVFLDECFPSSFSILHLSLSSSLSFQMYVGSTRGSH